MAREWSVVCDDGFEAACVVPFGDKVFDPTTLTWDQFHRGINKVMTYKLDAHVQCPLLRPLVEWYVQFHSTFGFHSWCVGVVRKVAACKLDAPHWDDSSDPFADMEQEVAAEVVKNLTSLLKGKIPFMRQLKNKAAEGPKSPEGPKSSWENEGGAGVAVPAAAAEALKDAAAGAEGSAQVAENAGAATAAGAGATATAPAKGAKVRMFHWNCIGCPLKI